MHKKLPILPEIDNPHVTEFVQLMAMQIAGLMHKIFIILRTS